MTAQSADHTKIQRDHASQRDFAPWTIRRPVSPTAVFDRGRQHRDIADSSRSLEPAGGDLSVSSSVNEQTQTKAGRDGMLEGFGRRAEGRRGGLDESSERGISKRQKRTKKPQGIPVVRHMDRRGLPTMALTPTLTLFTLGSPSLSRKCRIRSS